MAGNSKCHGLIDAPPKWDLIEIIKLTEIILKATLVIRGFHATEKLNLNDSSRT